MAKKRKKSKKRAKPGPTKRTTICRGNADECYMLCRHVKTGEFTTKTRCKLAYKKNG